MKKAIYAGSFDPITNGHLWMIEEGARLFDELIVSIGVNPDKKYAFSLEERADMITRTVSSIPNVSVDTFEKQFLVHYARGLEADYILRGIRSVADFEFERTMRHINSDMDGDISTVFFMPPRDISEISSSFVRGLVGPEGWEEIVAPYVPDIVLKGLIEKLR